MWSDILKRRGYRAPKPPRLFIQLVDDLFKKENIPLTERMYRQFLTHLGFMIQSQDLPLKSGQTLLTLLQQRDQFNFDDIKKGLNIPVREFITVNVDRGNLSPVELMQKVYPIIERALDALKESLDLGRFDDEELSEGERITEIKEFAESIGARFIPNRRAMSVTLYGSQRGNRPTADPIARERSYYRNPAKNVRSEIVYTDINDVIFNIGFDDEGVSQLILSKAKVGKLPRTTHSTQIAKTMLETDRKIDVIPLLSNIARNDHFQSGMGIRPITRTELLKFYVFTLNHINANSWYVKSLRPNDMSADMSPRAFIVTRIADNYRRDVETTAGAIREYSGRVIESKMATNRKFNRLMQDAESVEEEELVIRRFFPGLFEPYFIPRRGRKAERVSIKNIPFVDDSRYMPPQVGDREFTARPLPRPATRRPPSTTLSISIANKLDELGIRNTASTVRAVNGTYVTLYTSLNYGDFNSDESPSPRVLEDTLDYLQGDINLEEIREEYNVPNQAVAILEDAKIEFNRMT